MTTSNLSPPNPSSRRSHAWIYKETALPSKLYFLHVVRGLFPKHLLRRQVFHNPIHFRKIVFKYSNNGTHASTMGSMLGETWSKLTRIPCKSIWEWTSFSCLAVLGSFIRSQLSLMSRRYLESTVDALGDVFLPNLVGCWLIGIQVTRKHDSSSINVSIAFCGCLTSFSSWMMYVSSQILDHHDFESILFLVWTFASFSAAFALGRHFGMERFSEVSIFFLSVISVVISLFLWNPDLWDLSIFVFAPCGALLRFTLCQMLNKERLPGGTFLANFFACVLTSVASGLSFDLSDVVLLYFCGSLSTVSSFVKECDALVQSRESSVARAAIYTLITFSACLAVSMGILALL